MDKPNFSGMTKALLKEIGSYFIILIAILAAGLGIKGYLLSSHFIDGGVTGISMLVNATTGLPLSILLPLINLPFIVLAYKQMGLKLAVKSSIAIAGFAFCLAFVNYPDVTADKLLTAIFGGFFIGLGIGLAIRAGAVLDGTEIAALLISKKTVFKVADVILLLNIIIFACAAFLLDVERASYSIITYIVASKTIDFLLYGLEEYTGVTIVSSQSELIRETIINEMGRGVTVYSGKRGYGRRGESEEENDILLVVVTRLEVQRLKAIVGRFDKRAFIMQSTVNDIQGGMIKPRALH